MFMMLTKSLNFNLRSFNTISWISPMFFGVTASLVLLAFLNREHHLCWSWQNSANSTWPLNMVRQICPNTHQVLDWYQRFPVRNKTKNSLFSHFKQNPQRPLCWPITWERLYAISRNFARILVRVRIENLCGAIFWSNSKILTCSC